MGGNLILGAVQMLTPFLPHRPPPPQVMAFSPTDKFLASVGRDPERSVVVWDLTGGDGTLGSGTEATMVSVGRTKGPVVALAWLPLRPLPQFVTAGADGLLLWTLRADCLELTAVDLPHPRLALGQQQQLPSAAAACTAVAAEEDGVVVVAVASGGVYQIKVRAAHTPYQLSRLCPIS